MFIDSRGIDNSSALESTICIAGGGIAGITLALELADAGIDVIVIESGGFKSDKATEDLYRGENVGLPYMFDHHYRSRFFGGSSNCWGGWNRPLEPEDFAKRSWIPYSGWPITYEELQPFYARTHAVLQLGPPNFDAEFWGNAITGDNVRRMPLTDTRIQDSFSQFSPPARLGVSQRERMKADPHIRVLLHANVVNIATNDSAQAVTRLEVATLTGKRFTVSAQRFVLAMGGIENARLLLASNQTRANGLGNDGDNVGRYFMDHPRLQSGTVHLREPWKNHVLYDIKYHKTRLLHAHGAAVAAQFVLKPEVIREEHLLQARTSFRSVFAIENSPRVEALYRHAHAAAHSRGDKAPGKIAHLAGSALKKIFTQPPFLRAVRCEIIVEPDPNPNSRITLSNDSKDALGMPRARVSWQLGSLVQKTLAMTLQILSVELSRAGIADISLSDLFSQQAWPENLLGTWHHMGTTRMSTTPAEGVVDSDCRVHGMHNLYIAGSSIFPTAGGNFPTMTLTALAIRLADHLKEAVRKHELDSAPQPTPRATTKNFEADPTQRAYD